MVCGGGSLSLTGEVEWVLGWVAGGGGEGLCVWEWVVGADASLLGNGGLRRRGLYRRRAPPGGQSRGVGKWGRGRGGVVDETSRGE